MVDSRGANPGETRKAASFVGRGRELDKIATGFLDTARMITVTGPGGIGKTWLAAEAAWRYHKATGTPVHWVRLARLPRNAGAAAVEEEVAQSVLDIDFSSRSAWHALVDTLTRTDAVGRELQSILVMDNCEHVLAAAGRVIAELLEAAAGLTVLATSREVVGWVDERVVPVPPLTRGQALALFEQRAEAAGHPPLGAAETAAAAEICRHADHNPLYIRLAAARLRHQPMAAVLRELNGAADDRRMRWSHGPRVGAEARHRGVADVIGWSYELCDERERLLLERMSVFAAGYDANPEDSDGVSLDVGAELAAIEEICAGPGRPTDEYGDSGLPREQIEELLERLVDRSLVTVHMAPTRVRYSLLESIRVFARERLAERGGDEWDRLVRRHLLHYRDKVVYAQTNWLSPAEEDMLDWARAAWDNLRVAIEGSVVTPEAAVLGMQTATGLVALRAPMFKGSLREIRRWIESTLRAVQASASQSDIYLILAQALLCWVALCQGERADAEQALEECLAMCFPDPAARPNWRADCDITLGLPAPVDFVWGVALMMIHRDVRAIGVLARAREKYGRMDRPGAAAVTELFEALAAGLLGSAEQAMAIARRHLDRVTVAGAGSAIAWARLAFAVALTRNGDPTEALTVQRTALECQLAIRDQWGALWAVHMRMWSLTRLITDLTAAGNTDAATTAATETARLIGGARVLRASVGVELRGLGPFADETDKSIDIARRMLGDEPFEAAERQGARLRPESREIQRLALGSLRLDEVPAERTEASARWEALTAAEQEVALLAAAGFANTAIAARRGSSFKTVGAQMTAIFQKLMIGARGEIIQFVPERLRDRVREESARRPARRPPGPRTSRQR